MSVFKAFNEIEKKVKANEISEKIADLKNLLASRGITVVEEEKPKKTNPLVIALAIIGAVAAVAGIAYCVYRFLIPEDSEDFEDFDEDFDYEDFDDEDEDDIEEE